MGGVVPQYDSIEDYLETLSIPEPNTGCILWLGTGDRQNRYGKINYGSYRNRAAHRVAYEIVHGPIGEGLCICHHCDTPACINPDHLYAGTHQNNANDRDSRGRHYQANQTHCKRGHKFTKENTYFCKDGWRRCRACRRAALRTFRNK